MCEESIGKILTKNLAMSALTTPSLIKRDTLRVISSSYLLPLLHSNPKLPPAYPRAGPEDSVE